MFDMLSQFKGFVIAKFMKVSVNGVERWVLPAEWNTLRAQTKTDPNLVLEIMVDGSGEKIMKNAVGIHYMQDKSSGHFQTYWIDIFAITEYKE